jgi:hypothetical protein
VALQLLAALAAVILVQLDEVESAHEYALVIRPMPDQIKTGYAIRPAGEPTASSARGSIQSASPAWRDTEQPIGFGAVINPSIALAHARFPVSLDFLLLATIGDDAQAGSHFIVLGHIEPLWGVDAGSLILMRAESDKFKMTIWRQPEHQGTRIGRSANLTGNIVARYCPASASVARGAGDPFLRR